MGVESHYSSKKDRVFVRGIEGQYSLKEELARLRAQPRVIKGAQIEFNDGPQAFSRHYVEPKDGVTQTLHIHLEEYGPGARSQKHGHVNEAAFYILDGTGYDPLRLEGGRCGDRAQQLRASAFQRRSAEAGARLGDQDQADVHVHEHAIPEIGRAAPYRTNAGRRCWRKRRRRRCATASGRRWCIRRRCRGSCRGRVCSST